MVGLTHSALRQIIFGFGGLGLASTEMLSARRLPRENPGVSPYLIRTASEKPLSYQLLISTVEELAPAIDKLHELKAEAIGLNKDGTLLEVFVSPQGTWTVLVSSPQGHSCIAAIGEGWQFKITSMRPES